MPAAILLRSLIPDTRAAPPRIKDEDVNYRRFARKLKPLGDSTLAMVRELLRRGHSLFWGVGEGVEFAGEVMAWAAPVLSCAPDKTVTVGPLEKFSLKDLDAVMIRKDPPFNANYVRLCWLLALAESKVWMFNRPSLLLRYHEKLVPLEAQAQGYLTADDVISTFIGTKEHAKHFVTGQKISQVIAKPFLGFGGGGIELVDDKTFLSQAVNSDTEEQIVQPFHEEVARLGDRRVFFLEGEILAQFTRMPKTGGFVSNLAQGGSAISQPLEKSQVEVLHRLGRFLKSAQLELAGADLIGNRISEVNVTSPTGLVNLLKLEGKNYAEPIVDFMEKSVTRFRKVLH